jgi:hypothetical protein
VGIAKWRKSQLIWSGNPNLGFSSPKKWKLQNSKNLKSRKLHETILGQKKICWGGGGLCGVYFLSEA